MFLQLDSNGEYSTPPHSKLAYGTMVPLLEYYDELDRYFIAAHSYLDMIRCVFVPVLSIKGVWPWRELSQLRSDMLLCDANFPVLKGHLKIKFLTYTAWQYRVLSLIAEAFALRFTGQFMQK